ncbi:MAG TPA: ChrR family anti-sigma-E factor [Rhizomicrobium sp.]|nr:ChrR family anti-sigma-E factor [Rhizomicrobium sp.]
MIRHHPSADILADYARGTLNQGAMLVVGCHIDGCATCRNEAGLWEIASGAMLEARQAEPLKEGALEGALSKLDAPAPARSTGTTPSFLKKYAVPDLLKRERVGMRRWVTPNIWFAPVLSASAASSLTYLVYARANTVLSQHTHGGLEFTQVVYGSFGDSEGVFGPGDFAQTDPQILHSPTATKDSGCLCLISSEAPMQLTGTTARILQSLLGTLY